MSTAIEEKLTYEQMESRLREMEEILERYGEVQARFEELDGYALEGKAREVLAGLSFSSKRACVASCFL